jgi:hypothetical protein
MMRQVNATRMRRMNARWLLGLCAACGLGQQLACNGDGARGNGAPPADARATPPTDSNTAPSDGATPRDATPAPRDGASSGGDGATPGSGPQPLYPLRGANISQIHIDAERVWWVHGTFVYQAPLDGLATPAMIGIAEGGTLTRFATDATHVYWLSRDRIVRVPKSGGAAEEWPLGGNFDFGAFAMDDASVYVTNAFAASLSRMPKGGGALEVVADPVSTRGDQGGSCFLSLAGRTAYVGYLGGMYRVDLDTGQVQTVASGLAQVSNALELGDALYFVDGRSRDGCDVHRARAGAASEVVAHSAGACLTGPLVADPSAARFFFFPNTYGPLLAFDTQRGALAELTGTIWSSRYLAADAQHVYWTSTEQDAPAVMRMRKP